MIVHELSECYNVAKEEHDEENPKNVQIHEIEGGQAVERIELESTTYIQFIKTRKVNIGTTQNPKFV
jgi:hypothetical protein